VLIIALEGSLPQNNATISSVQLRTNARETPPVYGFKCLVLFFTIVAVFEWSVAVLSEVSGFVIFSLTGSLVFYISWLMMVRVALWLNGDHLAVEVKLEDKTSITISGGRFRSGFLGFNVSLSLHKNIDI